MGGREILKEKIQAFLQSLFDQEQKSKKVIYILVVACVALFLLIFGRSFSNKKDEDPLNEYDLNLEPVEETAKNEVGADRFIDDLEKGYEEDLKNLLEKTQNLSGVEVMVNLDSTDIKVYERNLMKGQQITNEQDNNGGTRKVEDQTEETEIVFMRQGDQEVPLLSQTKKPKVRGVLVVANGLEDAKMRMWVVEAVSKVLDVPTHKVSVMPREKEEKND